MSGKLDQSLDEILSTRRKTVRGRGRGRRVPTSTRVTTVAPTGGIQKNTRAKAAGKAAGTNGVTPALGDSKIIVSNLPSDVNEAQIKEYFSKSVAPVKRAMLTYGPNGISRGIATIIFLKPGSANEALVKLNGMLVDKRPMKIEVVLDAARATQPPTVKALGERMTQPKGARPKSAASKPAINGTNERGGKAGGGRGRPRRNAGRPKAKTADELDAEMADYFDPNAPAATTDAAATTNGAAQPSANGEDLGMDEIS
ncbi:MAG: hypothetical protein Q9164_005449 [Protoblastenia rupestris]